MIVPKMYLEYTIPSLLGKLCEGQGNVTAQVVMAEGEFCQRGQPTEIS